MDMRFVRPDPSKGVRVDLKRENGSAFSSRCTELALIQARYVDYLSRLLPRTVKNGKCPLLRQFSVPSDVESAVRVDSTGVYTADDQIPNIVARRTTSLAMFQTNCEHQFAFCKGFR